MARTKSRFVCQECGYVASSWLGRCPECGGWNTLVEEAEVTAKASKSYLPANNEKLRPRTIASVAQTKVERLATGIREFDRVLGGGVVQGSLVLLGGTPGIGRRPALRAAGNQSAVCQRRGIGGADCNACCPLGRSAGQ